MPATRHGAVAHILHLFLIATDHHTSHMNNVVDQIHDRDMPWMCANGNLLASRATNQNPDRTQSSCCCAAWSTRTSIHPKQSLATPNKSDNANNPIAGTLVTRPLGEMVPNVCAVIGLDASQAHNPVTHMEIIQYCAEANPFRYTLVGPISRHLMCGNNTQRDATTIKLS